MPRRIDRFRTIAAEDTPLTVACTQEAPRFSDVAVESRRANPMEFVNVRESAGWSSEAARAGPKMAALLAAAAEPVPPAPRVELESGGVILICGRDEMAVEAGNLLKDHLDVTVLIEPPAAITPPGIADFPVAKGKVRNARGHLSAFEVMVDDFAQPAPSSRGALMFGPSRDNARSNCDIILDLTGGTAFFPSADLRDGYLRADPGNPAAMLQAVLKARDLTGTFEKPRYVSTTSRYAPILGPRSLVARAASIFVLRPPSRLPAITWPSKRTFARAAGNALLPVLPGQPLTRCPPKMC
jgi:hypothetical protein